MLRVLPRPPRLPTLSRMGPRNAATSDTLFTSLNWLRDFRKRRPDVIISYPSESPSEFWEVSLPGASAIAFSSVETMVAALEEIEAKDARMHG